MTTTATRNLAREVAEALGWKIVHPDWMSEGHYELYSPSGMMIYCNGFGVLNDEMIDSAIPDYPNDLNACARDLTREGYELVIHQRNHTSRGKWFAQYINDNTINAFTGWADTPAIAVCEAFLALCKHVDGQGGEGR